MDHSSSSSPSSSSSHYKGLLHSWEETQPLHQERDWLSSSASLPTRMVQDGSLEDDDDDNINNNIRGQGGGATRTSYGGIIEKEHMFDKVVTPSDVGKLNRLVIPKQHAEKYFPLDSSTSCNTQNKAGLLLNFEDRTGKSWRFRYSYWNSSQSYVMTKGWSRFVKEKQLSAGDIVSFQRGIGDELARQTFFIDWRRRPHDYQHHHHNHHHLGTAFSVHHSIPGVAAWSSSSTTPAAFLLRSHPYNSSLNNVMPVWDRSSTSTTHLSPVNSNVLNMLPYPYGSSGASVVNNPQFSAPTGSLIFLRPSSLSPSVNPYTPSNHSISSIALASGGGSEPRVYESAPLVRVSPPLVAGVGGGGGGGGAKKSLRLFGVNMDCSASDHHQNVDIDGDDQVSPMVTNTISATSPSSTRNFDLDPK